MGGIYRLGCTLKKLLRSKVIQGHLRASWASIFIKLRNMQFLLNFFKVTKVQHAKSSYTQRKSSDHINFKICSFHVLKRGQNAKSLPELLLELHFSDV